MTRGRRINPEVQWWQDLILSVGQVHGDGDSFIQLLWGHDVGNPGGSHVLVVHITERVGIKVQTQHSVRRGVLDATGDAVSAKTEREHTSEAFLFNRCRTKGKLISLPFNERVHPWVSLRTTTLRLCVEFGQNSCVHLHYFPVPTEKQQHQQEYYDWTLNTDLFNQGTTEHSQQSQNSIFGSVWPPPAAEERVSSSSILCAIYHW